MSLIRLFFQAGQATKCEAPALKPYFVALRRSFSFALALVASNVTYTANAQLIKDLLPKAPVGPLAAPLASASSTSIVDAPNRLPPEPLVNAAVILSGLQAGGVAIYMYHPATDNRDDDKSGREWWKNCATTQALSKSSIEAAVAIGNAIKRMRIPVSEVRVSEFCRTLDTGTAIQIGFPKIQANLNSAEVQRSLGRTNSQIADNIRTQLMSVPTTGTSTIFVGHLLPIEASPDPILAGLAPGDAILFKRTPKDGLQMFARLRPGQWETLAQEDEDQRIRVAREIRLREEWLEQERERYARETAARLATPPPARSN